MLWVFVVIFGIAVFMWVRLGLCVFIPRGVIFFAQFKKVRDKMFLWPTLHTQPMSRFEKLCWWAGYGRWWVYRKIVLGVSIFVVVAFALFGRITWLVVGFLILSGAVAHVRARALRNKTAFTRELPEALTSLIDTLRAGYVFSQAIRFLATEGPVATRPVFLALVRADALHIPRAEALLCIGDQLEVPAWNLLVDMLVVHNELGGSIVSILEDVGKTLRDQERVANEIKALTAPGRLSGYLVAALVPIVLVFFFVASPTYITALFTSTLGQILFGTALALECIGFLWIRILTKVDY